MQPGLFRFVLRLALATLLLHWQAFGKLVNVTIDDTLGDSRTGQMPAYLPEKVWTNSSVLCPSGTCWGQPPPSCARNKTWHATTSVPQAEWPDSSQLTLQFEGTAVYIYGIADLSIGPFISNTFLGFYLDGELSSFTFESNPMTSASNDEYECNTLLYKNTTMLHGLHNITILNGGPSHLYSLLLFDYAIYSFDDAIPADSQPIPYASSSTTSSNPSLVSSSTSSSFTSSFTTVVPTTNSITNSPRPKSLAPGAIGGIVAAVVGSLLLVGIFAILYIRRRRRREAPAEQPGSFLTMGRDTPLPLRAFNALALPSHRSPASSAEDLRPNREIRRQRSDLGQSSTQGRSVLGATSTSSSSTHPYTHTRTPSYR